MDEQRRLAFRLGLQLTNHTALYATSAGIVFAVGLLNLAVLTRFLTIDEFGLLAVLLVFSALLTIVYNLVSLQGTFGLVYRGGGEEEIAIDSEVLEAETSAVDKRGALTTGLVLTLVVTAVGTAVTCLFAGGLSQILGDVPASWVRLAAASGASGAIWRFVVNVLRFERRPISFVAMNALRPLAVLGLSIPLVVSGHGVPGVLFATTVGTAAAVLVVLAASAASYSTAIQWTALKPIVRIGAFLVPVILAFWVVQNVDLYLVSVFADESEAARYRVAARIAAGMAYFVSAFLMAWMPLSRTLVHQAVSRRHGPASTAGTMLLYFWATALWVVLGLALLSDLLVKVAPGTYGPAAPLIPLIAAGFVAYGSLIVVHRSAVIAHKMFVYVGLAVLAAVVFTVTALVLIPLYGAYGAAVAPVVGFGVATAVELYLSQRGQDPIEIPFGRLAAITLVGLLTWAVSHIAADTAASLRLIFAIGLTATFPVMLSSLSLVQLPSITELRAAGRRSREAAFRQRLPGGESGEWELAEMLLSEGRTVAEAADRLGLSEEEALVRFARLIEGVAATTVPDGARADTARYLLMAGPAAIRDDASVRVLAAGVDPEALVDLETAREVVRRAARPRGRDTAPAAAGGAG
jgi:O-antigen/teichoic acid export membrane protein